LPRLQSIGELRLFHDQQPCLRCRATQKEVGTSSSFLFSSLLFFSIHWCLWAWTNSCFVSLPEIQCDRGQPCSACSNLPLISSEDHWAVIGCFRSSLSAFTDYLLPGIDDAVDFLCLEPPPSSLPPWVPRAPLIWTASLSARTKPKDLPNL
jgi:hypothetical protein